MPETHSLSSLELNSSHTQQLLSRAGIIGEQDTNGTLLKNPDKLAEVRQVLPLQETARTSEGLVVADLKMDITAENIRKILLTPTESLNQLKFAMVPELGQNYAALQLALVQALDEQLNNLGFGNTTYVTETMLERGADATKLQRRLEVSLDVKKRALAWDALEPTLSEALTKLKTSPLFDQELLAKYIDHIQLGMEEIATKMPILDQQIATLETTLGNNNSAT